MYNCTYVCPSSILPAWYFCCFGKLDREWYGVCSEGSEHLQLIHYSIGDQSSMPAVNPMNALDYSSSSHQSTLVVCTAHFSISSSIIIHQTCDGWLAGVQVLRCLFGSGAPQHCTDTAFSSRAAHGCKTAGTNRWLLMRMNVIICT